MSIAEFPTDTSAIEAVKHIKTLQETLHTLFEPVA